VKRAAARTLLAITAAFLAVLIMGGCAGVRKMAEYWPVCGRCQQAACR
jgi:hypothetical protein